jgi:hypothetical protein
MDDLSPVIGGMIHDMREHIREVIEVRIPGYVFVGRFGMNAVRYSTSLVATIFDVVVYIFVRYTLLLVNCILHCSRLNFYNMALSRSSRYRAAGVFLAITGFLGLWVASWEGLINVYRIILPGYTLPDGAYPYPANFWDVNAAFGMVSACMLTIGTALVFLAKEPDEYLYKIRLESIQFAVIAQFLVGLIAFAYFYLHPVIKWKIHFRAFWGSPVALSW